MAESPGKTADQTGAPAQPEKDSQSGGGQRPADERAGSHFRRLLVFQVKLYLDALRDLVMSPLSIGAFLIDLATGKRGEDSAFEAALHLGRKSEKAINLFNQHDKDAEDYRGIDTLIDQMEEGLRNEYRDGSVSTSARDTIENTLARIRDRTRRHRHDET